ncbi:glutamic acid-rich protein-like [Amphibalanus amphitrite]|uniref:glutamic acid-rich protein-like n=1 Tax=Amphibalanus amphitrite TaxID=1232801 RepID=UPI001C90673D|nr:glutamic acid-rich protein-like [Amphibalanus amphitrite]XP_043231725.1 glutamic acid-rich protein-like [Amphibalanus amphitrite]XP_043231727.1 glutamic acid-rich protein-like [Amphibalanus amphitrite]
MSRYYPNSRGGTTPRGSRGGYYSSSYSRGGGYSGSSRGGYSSSSRVGYSSSGRGGYGGSGGYSGGGSGGYYDSRSAGGASSGGTGRYYPARDRRDAGTGGSHRERLEIAQKLVDTLISSGGTAGGVRRPSDHYSAAGEPPYKRPRDDLYDRDRSSSTRSRHADYLYNRRDDYVDRRPRDDYHAPTRRPFRARGYAPRRGTGYVPRGGGPPRRQHDDSRDRSFVSRKDAAVFGKHGTGAHLVTKCPHCHARCATFADFRKHQLGREHMAAMRRLLMKVRAELGKMRLAQREEQKKLEAAEIEKDPEFENQQTQFCTLCRLQYREIEGVIHSETEWHRKQHTYSNPSCKTCNMNFPARIAYEKHLGTFTHIQKTNQSERRAERRDAAEFQKGGFMTLDSVGDVDEEENARGRNASAQDDSGEPKTSATELLAELGEYDGKHAVGSNHMRKTEVYHCGLCDIYIKITSKVNAVLIKHCMGKKHFENYRKNLTTLAEQEEEERKAAEAEAERQKKEQQEKEDQEDAEQQDTPEKTNGQDEGKDADAAGEDAAAADEGGREEPPAGRGEDASWEQMDDNFLLGDDQEEETGSEKRTVGVTE